MNKAETDAKNVLKKLGDLSCFLVDLDRNAGIDQWFNIPIDIMHKTMSFDVSVLYKITNIIENRLLLEIKQIFDPNGYRTDLIEKNKLQLDLKNPEKIYINEVISYKTKKVSSINVPNIGCDIMGFVYLPESFGGGYLFGGDFCGKESSVRDYEVSVFEIICNLISTTLIKMEFENLAVFDSLTKLYNSRKIKEEVKRICSRLERKTNSRACLVMCDIDNFKKVNDTYGHIQGDLVLKEIGSIISTSMREYFDIAGRYGGEEFLIVFEETDQDASFAVIERIRKNIKNHKFTRTDKTGNPVPGQFLTITMSFGIAENNPDLLTCNEKEWISRADAALYRSKKDGRNRTTIG